MPFHLAYPQVFEYKNEIYMISDGWSNLQMYKATEFPLKWEKLKDLHANNYIDPTIVFYQNTWWMFAHIEQHNSFHLHILYADTPLGPWTGHPNNCFIAGYNKDGVADSHNCLGGKEIQTHHKTGPLRRGQIGIRSGGRAFVYKGKLYRMVQHSKDVYGKVYVKYLLVFAISNVHRLLYLGDGLDMYEVTSISKDKPVVEVMVQEFHDNYRDADSVGK